MKISPQQVLIPKKVYIGDPAELRCTFNSNVKNLVEAGFSSQTEFGDYEIRDIKLLHSGTDFYQLSITFVPWKTGDLFFPNYRLVSEANPETSVEISFSAVNIQSVSEQVSASTLRDVNPPLLLPGTTYKLYAILLVFLAVSILLINLIIKRKKVSLFFKERKLRRKYKKNERLTIKLLKNLLKTDKKSKKIKKSAGDAGNSELQAEEAYLDSTTRETEVASQIQKIMRNYLEIRFDLPFTKITSPDMKINLNLSQKKQEAFNKITDIFTFTDKVRYCKNFVFSANEQERFIMMLLDSITVIEEIEKAEENQEAV